MAASEHKAYALEKEHLNNTLVTIEREQEVAQADRLAAEGSLSTARMYDADALPLREMMYMRALQTERNLTSAHRRPYFTRIDFIEKNGVKNVYYIGRYGVFRTDSLEVEVVDWRAPVANLYYSGQIGPLKYESPEGAIEGELTLKRQFSILDGEISTIFDADLVSQDEYLQGVLGENTGDRLKEIVTTIQAEQNYVIRYPLEKNLVVQGVAGSGKTTIALHRIAYLLYSYQQRLKADSMLIIAPNPLFLNFIAQVLPDLGVDNVVQTTFLRLMADHLDGALPKISAGMKLDEILSMPKDELDKYSGLLKLKGSLKTMKKLDKWLDAFEDAFPLSEDIKFGPIIVFSAAEQRKFLLVDEKPFPLSRRLSELKKQLRLRVKNAANTINDWYAVELDKRIMDLPKTIKDKKARTLRGEKLHESLIKRQAETKKLAQAFPNEVLKRFPDISPSKLYQRFMLEEFGIEIKKFEREDAAPIALIATRVMELKRLDIRHVVIDEAQDFNPFEFMLIKRIARSATFTIVGDLMQGVNGYRGLDSWEEITDGVFDGGCQRHELVTSYRNTVEIMEFATRVVKNMPVNNLNPAVPVLRHGDEPEFREGGIDDIKIVVNKWIAEGLSSIAVVTRSHKKLNDMSKSLGYPVLDPEANEYPAGVVLAPADAVKGLEFDGVIIMDADEKTYPLNPLDARLLYVSLTRALHKMAVFYTGKPSPLLRV